MAYFYLIAYFHDISILDEFFKVSKAIPKALKMRNKLYARNTKTVAQGKKTIFFLSLRIWVLIQKKYRRF